MNKSYAYYAGIGATFCGGVIIICVILMLAIKFLLPGYTLGVGSVKYLIPLPAFSAIYFAPKFYKHEARKTTFVEGWILALILTLIGLAMLVFLVWLGLRILPHGELMNVRSTAGWEEGRSARWIIFAVYGGFILALTRFLVWVRVRYHAVNAAKVT